MPVMRLLFTAELGRTRSTSCSSQRALSLVMKLGGGLPLKNFTCICVFAIESTINHIDIVLSMQFAVLPLRFTCICVFTCLYCQCAMLWHYLYSRTVTAVTAVTAVRCGRSHDQSLEN